MWYCGNAGRRTHEVGTRAANRFGLHDMHGNLWERCAGAEKGRLEDGPLEDALTVIRGGSWYSTAEWTRSASRHVSLSDRVGRRLGRPLVETTIAGSGPDAPTEVEVTEFEWGGWRSPHIGFRPAADLPE